MNRFNSMLAVALVGAGLSAGAIAQDKPATPKSPSSKTTKQMNPANPSNENMDDNAQRAHDPKRNKSASSSSNKPQQVATGEVRNWKAIDKNHDNLISPDEMEASLKSGSAKTKK